MRVRGHESESKRSRLRAGKRRGEDIGDEGNRRAAELMCGTLRDREKKILKKEEIYIVEK